MNVNSVSCMNRRKNFEGGRPAVLTPLKAVIFSVRRCWGTQRWGKLLDLIAKKAGSKRKMQNERHRHLYSSWSYHRGLDGPGILTGVIWIRIMISGCPPPPPRVHYQWAFWVHEKRKFPYAAYQSLISQEGLFLGITYVLSQSVRPATDLK